jgi:signal peptidase I
MKIRSGSRETGKERRAAGATEPGAEERLEARSFLAEVWDWMKATVAALIVVLLIHQFGFNFSTVRGHSMQPTLEEGEWLFVNRAAVSFGKPRRGDVVILKEPAVAGGDDRSYLVKRVVAVSGDKVEIRRGKLYVNGQEQAEPYVDTPAEDGDYGPTVVGEKCVFVMGDNRHRYASEDSRTFGPVPLKLVQGRAEFIMWPFSKKGWL